MEICSECGQAMIRAEVYDPSGEIPLHGGEKIYNGHGDLVSWFVCINSSCEMGRWNTTQPITQPITK